MSASPLSQPKIAGSSGVRHSVSTKILTEPPAVRTYSTFPLAQPEFSSPRNGPFAGYLIELLSGGSVIASVSSSTSSGGAGTFSDATLSYTAQAADPIGLLGISIGVLNFGHLDIDNVRLDASMSGQGQVPEPSTLLLFGTGLGVAAYRRRRKQ